MVLRNTHTGIVERLIRSKGSCVKKWVEERCSIFVGGQDKVVR